MTFFKKLIEIGVAKNECFTYKHEKKKQTKSKRNRATFIEEKTPVTTNQQTENPDDVFTSRSLESCSLNHKSSCNSPVII